MARGAIFTEFEIAYIQANYSAKTRHDVARHLNRSVNYVTTVASKLGLTNPRPKSTRRRSVRHNGAIKADGEAIGLSRSDATYESSIREATKRLGAACAALAAKSGARA